MPLLLKWQCNRTLGRLGNCYFLAAVAACASQEQDTIIRDLIVEQGHDVGVYGIKFFMDGRWVTTVIDDYFPCVRAGDGSWQPLFASSKRTGLLTRGFPGLWDCGSCGTVGPRAPSSDSLKRTEKPHETPLDLASRISG